MQERSLSLATKHLQQRPRRLHSFGCWVDKKGGRSQNMALKRQTVKHTSFFSPPVLLLTDEVLVVHEGTHVSLSLDLAFWRNAITNVFVTVIHFRVDLVDVIGDDDGDDRDEDHRPRQPHPPPEHHRQLKPGEGGFSHASKVSHNESTWHSHGTITTAYGGHCVVARRYSLHQDVNTSSGKASSRLASLH